MGFSIAHFYCFPYEEWKEGYRPKEAKDNTTFIQTMAMKDFVSDLKLVMSSDGVRGRGSKKKKVKDNDDGKDLSDGVTTIPEEGEEKNSASVSSKDSGKCMDSKGKVAAKEKVVDDVEGGDEEEEHQSEALIRATTRLLSKRDLISKLAENEEDIEKILSQEQEILSQEKEEILSQEEQDEEGGLVEIDVNEVRGESNNDTNQEEEKEKKEEEIL